jgi:hypothetical protein
MKYLKMLGLAAVAAMALMAFVGAGTASATKLCKNSTSTVVCSEPYGVGTEIKSKLTGSAILETTGGTTLDTCTGGEVNGKIEKEGSATATVSGKNSAITWTGCSVPTTTLATGELEIHAKPELNSKGELVDTDNGTLTASGAEVTVNTGFFGACVYGTGTGKDLGTLLGGSPATLAISTNVTLTKNESGLCPSETKWTAEYTVTEPKPLYVSTS